MSVGRDRQNLFPAGTAVSQLAVYDWTGPDDLPGGSAHVHLACTEGYVVTGGRGMLQTLSGDGYAETQLTPMTVAWFSPGVVHRLINDGGLQILDVMQNAGLPEAGDSVLTFPPAYLSDPDTYRTAASVDQASPEAAAESARRRRQLAVEGFLVLRDRWQREGSQALDDFYAAAASLVRDHTPAWRDTWAHGPLTAAVRTGEQLEQLALGRHAHLWQGRLDVLSPPADRSYGMCGRLAAYPAAAADRSVPSGQWPGRTEGNPPG